MADALAPRGPDGSGAWAHGSIALGHRRLRIIDLSERGAQPMVDSELGLAVVFNGCIYNHRELRARARSRRAALLLRQRHRGGAQGLPPLGRALRRSLQGDVRVRHRRARQRPARARARPSRRQAAVPRRWIDGAALRLDSARAPARRRRRHHDRPRRRCITTSAGTRSCRRRARSWPACASCRRPRCSPSSPTAGVPATTYWDPPFARDPARADWTPEDWQDAMLEALRVAVDRRMVADVPVGVLLSGGLDSSLIVALLAQAGQRGLKTFSVGFPAAGGREGDEFAYSDLVAERFDTDHRQIRVDDDRLLPALHEAVAAMSEPMVSHDCVAFHLLSEEVSRHVKVVQCGQGADEILAGYSWYQPLPEAEGDGSRSLRAGVLRPPARRARRPAGRRRPARRGRQPAVRRRALRAPGRRWPRRSGAAPGQRGDARRRPGQARGQHDDGLRPGGAHAVPRPRSRRARGRVPAGAQARPWRQGRAQGGRAARAAGRGHRPPEGLLPRARAQPPRGSLRRARARGAARPGGARPRPVRPGVGRPPARRRPTSTSPRCRATACGSSACSSCGFRSRACDGPAAAS